MAEKVKIKLGDVELDAVLDENVNRVSEVTDKPVEKGQDVSDHMKEKPKLVKLSGSVVNDAAAKLALLESYKKEAKLLKYVGRNAVGNVVLELLDTKHPKENAEGFDFNITLKHIRIASPEEFEVKVKNPKTKKSDGKTKSKVKKKTNAGRQQPVASGGKKNTSQDTKKIIDDLGQASFKDLIEQRAGVTADFKKKSNLGYIPEVDMTKNNTPDGYLVARGYLDELKAKKEREKNK